MGLVNAVCTALAAAAVLLIRRRLPGLALPLSIAAVSVAVWNGLWALERLHGIDNRLGTAAAFVSVEIAASAWLVVCKRLRWGRWRPPIALQAAFVVVPVVVLLTLAAAPSVGAQNYRDSFAFAIHVIYTFGLMIAALAALYPLRLDPARLVHASVWWLLGAGVAVLAAQVAYPALSAATAVLLGPPAILATWRPEPWLRVTQRGKTLLDAVGVPIFILDPDHRLVDWNAPAERLLLLASGLPAARGLDPREALGLPDQLLDRQIVSTPVQGGTLRSEISAHRRDPQALASDLVVMMRPVHSTVDQIHFSSTAGRLESHDPATETLSRTSILRRVVSAANEGRAVVRCEVTAEADRHGDEVVFLVARRLAAWAPQCDWGRAGPWTLVGVPRAGSRVGSDDLVGLDADADVTITLETLGPDRSVREFADWVCRPGVAPSGRASQQ